MTPLVCFLPRRRRRAPVSGEADGWLGAGRYRRATPRRDARRGQGFRRRPPRRHWRVSGFVIVISGADTVLALQRIASL